MRLHAACLRAGDVTGTPCGEPVNDGGDRANAEKLWEGWLASSRPRQAGAPFDESLWAESLHLAEWAVTPNIEAVGRFADALLREPLLRGARLAGVIAGCRFVEPETEMPPLWEMAPEATSKAETDFLEWLSSPREM
jgi:hypothetical protein